MSAALIIARLTFREAARRRRQQQAGWHNPSAQP